MASGSREAERHDVSSHRLGLLLIALVVVVGCAPSSELLGPAEGRGARSTSNGDAPADVERARVASHVDGDTIRLVGEAGSDLLAPDEETSVRLLEIDTPEVARPGSPGECYADEASAALRRMLPVGALVLVAPDEEVLDPYGRTLLYLWTADGEFVNLRLVRRGYAKAVLYEPNDEYIERMRRGESRARALNRGLWGACA
jgi:micrococcal nuclease